MLLTHQQHHQVTDATQLTEHKLHISIRPERSRNHKRKHDITPLIFISLSASADCHSHSCYLSCAGRCFGLCYLGSLSLLIWPALSLVLSEMFPPRLQMVYRRVTRGQGGPGLEHHVAQEMAALCSLAFIRSAAMLEDLRSGSTLRS